MEIQFGERVGHGGWLIGAKLFCPKASKALRVYFSWWQVFKEVVLAKALTDGTGSLPLHSGWSRRREVIGAAGRREWWHEEQTVVNVVRI